jgi:predicted DNA-binding WGR domain protein
LVRNLTAAIHRQNGRLGDDGQFIQRKFSNEAQGILALMLKK